MSHPLDYHGHMNKRIQSQPVASLASLASLSTKRPAQDRAMAPGAPKPVERGLLGLCEEVAATLLRRQLETGDATRTVREVRRCLMASLHCDSARAGQIVDLSLELIHVKVTGRYRRDPLELSQLIARAGNQLRDVRHN